VLGALPNLGVHRRLHFHPLHFRVLLEADLDVLVVICVVLGIPSEELVELALLEYFSVVPLFCYELLEGLLLVVFLLVVLPELVGDATFVVVEVILVVDLLSLQVGVVVAVVDCVQLLLKGVNSVVDRFFLGHVVELVLPAVAQNKWVIIV